MGERNIPSTRLQQAGHSSRREGTMPSLHRPAAWACVDGRICVGRFRVVALHKHEALQCTGKSTCVDVFGAGAALARRDHQGGATRHGHKDLQRECKGCAPIHVKCLSGLQTR